jgi:hypothetical protein
MDKNVTKRYLGFVSFGFVRRSVFDVRGFAVVRRLFAVVMVSWLVLITLVLLDVGSFAVISWWLIFNMFISRYVLDVRCLAVVDRGDFVLDVRSLAVVNWGSFVFDVRSLAVVDRSGFVDGFTVVVGGSIFGFAVVVSRSVLNFTMISWSILYFAVVSWPIFWLMVDWPVLGFVTVLRSVFRLVRVNFFRGLIFSLLSGINLLGCIILDFLVVGRFSLVGLSFVFFLLLVFTRSIRTVIVTFNLCFIQIMRCNLKFELHSYTK